ncbi:isoaspartyl peptidase/L-asparaginase [Candidatus Bathyarchaeota archaeon]|nr:isoaspartyl peptidase/L-asparaginase [Candidatus Bathyarchaeota archaeon]
MPRPVIVVHGGAGTWHPERQKPGIEGVKNAALEGFKILAAGGSALDAVEIAVICLEDNEVFNAGKGSTLTIDKRVEMEASIMDGKTLKAGAVGLLRDLKNPVKLARIVMEKTDHVFLIGEGAEKLAEIFNLERTNPITELRLKYWKNLKEKLLKGQVNYLLKLHELIEKNPNLFAYETVGAVALDKHGNVAAATSTGGMTLKLPGRIGDSPLIGCGTYADNEAGACSATGIGEIAIRLVLAKTVCEYMRKMDAQTAVEEAIKLVNRRIANQVNFMGLIAVDKKGNVGAAHNSPNMCWAYMKLGMETPEASLTAKIIRQ